jgi:hypothetical protein
MEVSYNPFFDTRSSTHFSKEQRRGVLRLVASRDGRDGSIRIHQDAEMYASTLSASETVRHPLRPRRGAWLQVVRGELSVNGTPARAGDGLAVPGVDEVFAAATRPSELLLFDLA